MRKMKILRTSFIPDKKGTQWDMKKRQQVFRSFAMVTQLGVSVLTPILLCVAVGELLEKWFQLDVTVFLILLGILAGLRNMFVLAKNAAGKGDEDGKDE